MGGGAAVALHCVRSSGAQIHLNNDMISTDAFEVYRKDTQMIGSSEHEAQI